MNMTLFIDNFVVLYFLKPYKAARPFTTSNDSEEHFRRPEINLNPHRHCFIVSRGCIDV